MKFNALDLLKEIVAEQVHWSEADRQLTINIGLDWSKLMVRQQLGEDVAAELEIVKTSAGQIAAGANITGSKVISEWLQRLANLAGQFLTGII